MTGRLMLLDTAALYFRAFHGVPDTLTAPDGSPVNAVRGLLDIIARLVTEFAPTELVACWDDDWRPAWRVELIPSYKEHRVAREVPGGVDVEEVPEKLVAQIPLIRECLEALGISVIGAAGHEADDVIGSLAAQSGIPVDIVTSDRDLFQLIDDAAGIRVISTAKGMSKLEIVTDEVVVARYGVTPDQYADFAALRGDPSDGLPGVAGVGEKIAAALIGEHGDLAGVVEAAADPSEPMSAGIRSRIVAAADYLAVAPTVVEVVRDLDLGEFDARIQPVEDDGLAAFGALAEANNLAGSAERILAALAAA